MAGIPYLLWLIGLSELIAPPQITGDIQAFTNVQYGIAVTGESLELDLYAPLPSEGLKPAVVFIHGGGWFLNSRLDYQDFARGFARNGFIGVTPSFRLQPPDGFHGQVWDIKIAIRWLRENADTYGIDPNRIGIFGSSSGGHLAALATTAGDGEGFADEFPDDDTSVQAAFYLFGLYNLVGSNMTAIAGILEPDMPWGIPVDLLPRFSPVTYVSGNEPPTYLMHGAGDFMVPLPEAWEFHDAHEAAGVPVSIHVVPEVGHGFIKTRPWLRPLIYLTVREFFLVEFRGAP